MDISVLDILKNIFSIANLLLAAAGTLIGIIFGALPGFTAAMGVAVLLPLTFGMNPASGLILLGALFGGAMYGGAISAILINTPGTPAAAATCLDGYPCSKKGMAGEALQESVVSSFVGGIFGVTVLLFFAPPLAKISLMFGPPEYFLLAIFGLTIIATIGEGGLLKGLIAGVVGLMIATIGMDPLMGVPRFTMGIVNLIDGVQLVPAMIGLFSIPETLDMIRSHIRGTDEVVDLSKFKKIKVGWPSLKHLKEMAGVYLKASIIGTYVGILPGAGGSIASFMAYNEAKRTSKHPEEYGKGSIEGIGAAECSNNAVSGGALIPMLTLGVPGDSVAAIMMGGLMIHGLEPGAALFTRNADVVYTFIAALYIANIMMLLFGIYCGPWFAAVTKTPKHILSAFVMILTVIGSYALRGNAFDVYVMVAFGILGYIMKNLGFSVIPTVLGIILGPIAEKGLNGTLAISVGENTLFFMLGRPISLILIIFSLASIGFPMYRMYKEFKSKKAAAV